MFTFSFFFSKRKSGRPDFWKGVHIFVFDENQNVNTFPVQICTEKVFTFRFSSKTQMWTPFQKSGRPDLWFEEIENVNTFPKIWTARFAFWMKMKIRTPFENLNGQKLLRISTSGCKYKNIGLFLRSKVANYSVYLASHGCQLLFNYYLTYSKLLLLLAFNFQSAMVVVIYWMSFTMIG